MAVEADIQERWSDRTATVSAAGGRKLLRVFDVRLVDDVTGEPYMSNGPAAVELLGIFIADPHPDWASALCTSIEPAPDGEDPSNWVVKVQYEEPVPLPGEVAGAAGGGGGHGQTPSEPTARDPKISVSYRLEPVYERKDLDGKAFNNGAGDPLEDVPARYAVVGLIRFTIYKATYDFAAGVALMDKTNAAAWRGFGARTLKIAGVNANRVTERGRSFWEIEFLIEYYRDNDWTRVLVLNAGRRFKDAAGKLVNVSDFYGKNSSGIELLELNGTILFNRAVPTYISFRVRETADFTLIAPAS